MSMYRDGLRYAGAPRLQMAVGPHPQKAKSITTLHNYRSGMKDNKSAKHGEEF